MKTCSANKVGPFFQRWTIATAAAVYLVLPHRGADAANLTWAVGSGNWDTTSLNWNPGPTNFTDTAGPTGVDNVTFNSSGTVTISANMTPLSVTIGGSGVYTFNGGPIDGNGTLSSSGVLTLNGANSYSGGTTAAGTLNLGNNTALGSGTLVWNGGTLDSAGGARTLANALQLNAGIVINQSTLTFTGPVDLPSGIVRLHAENGFSALTFSGNISGNGGINQTGNGGPVTLSGNNSYAGPTTVSGQLTLTGNNSAMTNTVTITGTVRAGSNTALGSGKVIINNDGQLISVPVGVGSYVLANALQINGRMFHGGTMTLTGPIDPISGPTTIYGLDNFANLTIKSSITGSGSLVRGSDGGSSFLTLSGTNTYSGGTTVNGGYLVLGINDSLPTAGALAIGANGTFYLNGFNQTIGSLSGAGTVLTSGNTLTSGDSTSTTFSGVISSLGNLTKQGTGTFTLTGANDYSGITTMNAGILALSGASGALSSSSQLVVKRGATLRIDNSSNNNLNRLGNSAALKMQGGESVLIGNGAANTSETIGTTTVGAGSSIVTVAPGNGFGASLASSGLSRTDSGTILLRGSALGTAASPAANVANITYATAPTLKGAAGADNSTTISILPYAVGDNSISGNGTDFVTYNVTKGIRLLNASAGEYKTSITDGQSQLDNVKLTGSASVSSATTINSLLLGAGGGVSGSATLTIGSGAILAAGGANAGISVPTVALGANEGVLFALNDLSLSSAVTGSAGLTKAGNATLTMSGASTYSGPTTVNEGKLVFNGSLSANASSVLVRDSATLGGILSPGNSPGTLTFGGLTLTNASALNFELGPHNPDGSAIVGGGTNDLIVVNGDLTLDGLLNVTALSGFFDFGPSNNVYRLIEYTGSLIDNTLSIGSMPVGTLGTVVVDTNLKQVNLVVIPEPATMALAALGGLLLVRYRRR